jgi:hypothetical protein
MPGLLGWRRSVDRTGLHQNSLQTGNFTGNFAFLSEPAPQRTKKALDYSALERISLSELTGKSK